MRRPMYVNLKAEDMIRQASGEQSVIDIWPPYGLDASSIGYATSIGFPWWNHEFAEEC
jgi:hypothetical protein